MFSFLLLFAMCCIDAICDSQDCTNKAASAEAGKPSGSSGIQVKSTPSNADCLIMQKLPCEIQERIGLAFLCDVQNAVVVVTDIGDVVRLCDWKLSMHCHLVLKYAKLQCGLCESTCISLRAFILLAKISLIIVDFSTSQHDLYIDYELFSDELDCFEHFLAQFCFFTYLDFQGDLFDLEEHEIARQGFIHLQASIQGSEWIGLLDMK